MTHDDYRDAVARASNPSAEDLEALRLAALARKTRDSSQDADETARFESAEPTDTAISDGRPSLGRAHLGEPQIRAAETSTAQVSRTAEPDASISPRDSSPRMSFPSVLGGASFSLPPSQPVSDPPVLVDQEDAGDVSSNISDTKTSEFSDVQKRSRRSDRSRWWPPPMRVAKTDPPPGVDDVSGQSGKKRRLYWLTDRLKWPLLSAGLSLVAALTATTALLSGTRVLGHDPSISSAGVSLTLFLISVWVWNRTLRVRRGVIVPALLIASMVFAGAGLGVMRSVVVGGHVLLDTDPRAANSRFYVQLHDDVSVIRAALPLLIAQGADAQTHYNDYAEQSKKLGQIAADLKTPGTLPDPAFRQAADATASVDTVASKALTTKAETITEPNPQTEAALVATRDQLVATLDGPVQQALHSAATLTGLTAGTSS